MKKLILSFILATFCGISAFASSFSAVCESGQTLYYNITSSTSPYKVSVVNPSSASYYSAYATGDLTIPSSVTYSGITYSVTSIADRAFNSCSGLTSVTIPNSVTSIGEGAFGGCSGLLTVNFNATNCTHMGSSVSPVFGVCTSLATVNIGDNVTNIPTYAFYNCSGLTSVTIGSGVTNIGQNAFYGCSGLTRTIYTGNIAQWCGITFGDYAAQPLNYAHNLYVNSSLVTDLVIPNTVEALKAYAFYGARCLESVTIHESVTSIGKSAFGYCIRLTTVNFNATNCTDMGRASNPVFCGCTSLSTLNIGENVTNIPTYAFYGCSGLTSITIPNSVTSIGSAAFGGCKSLTEMSIPFVGGSATATIASDTTLLGYIFGTSSYIGGTSTKQYYSSNNYATYYIPSTLRHITVTGDNLLYGAFYMCSMLTDITIPNSITSIGDFAFGGCSGLTSVVIPNSVESIGSAAFNGCSGLVEMTIPFVGGSATATNESFGYIFGTYSYTGGTAVSQNDYYNYNTITYYIPASLRNVTLTGENIFSGAFLNCSMLTSITIPSSVTSIGSEAFYGCSGLPSITIPSSITEIGAGAFYGCSGLTAVYYNGSLEQWCRILFYSGDGNPLKNGHNLYIDGELVTNLTIPNSISTINFASFYGATCLNSVTIGDNVTSIGKSAFAYCSGLTSFSIANSVTSIGMYAFYECSGLTGELTIPDFVTYIGDYAFYNCSSLTGNLNIPSTVTRIYNYTYYGCNGLTGVLSIPNSVRSIDEYAFYGCSGLTGELNIPSSITAISNNTFQGCTGIESVTIPSSVTSIGEYAFSGCTSMTEVTIPESVTSISRFAFHNCSGLTTVNFNATNCTMGAYNGTVFSGSNASAIINIGNGVTRIANYAFNGLIGNDTLIIPNSVTSIGNSAFSGCSGLTSVAIGNSVTNIGDNAFLNCTGLTGALTIPNSVTSIGSQAFYNCSGLTSVTIGNSVTSIGNYAFNGCTGLTTLNFNAANCTTMGNYEFINCNALTTLNIGEAVTTIPTNAFKNCTALTNVNFNAENCEAAGTEADPIFPSSAISKITFGESVRRVPDYAFYSSLLVDTIVSYAVNPPAIYAHTFNFSEFPLSIPVIVPCGTVELYNDANYWYNFRRIQQRAGCGATFTITVQSNNSNYGTVSGGGIYEANAVAILTATPSNGYHFRNWSDGSRENPHRVTVTEDATYIATFLEGEPEPDITHSFSASACGSYTWNDHTYTQSGTYTQTFTAANYADSVVTLTLTIYDNPVPQISQSGELDACNPSSVTLSAGNYSTYNWSTGATTATISISEPGYYYVEVTDAHGCTGVSEQTNVGLSNALTEAPQISVVGMNSENHNVVAWSALDNENVNAYKVYRENNVADHYELMATVEISQTTWTDETADPSSRAYRYKLTAVDECGGESPMSDYHKTMHLTINQGIGNTWNLIWSHYEGFDFGTYRIYRGTMPSNMTMIGEVPSNLNSYTDNTATDNTGFYYQVEVVRNSRSRDAEISSRSNIVDNGYLPEFTITAMSSTPSRGTVTGGGTYTAGTVVTLTAIANEGYEFSMWSDENTDNPRTITVTENATYIAIFDPASSVQTYTITAISSAPNRGTVTGGGTYPEGTVVTLTAIANEGYEFSMWSDENTDNPRQITVSGDATYMAIFDPATEIEERIATEIVLFPNPANDILNITSSETISEIEIVNVMGQVVKRIEVNGDNVVCDVEELKAGVYVVRIHAASATLSQRKFVKE